MPCQSLRGQNWLASQSWSFVADLRVISDLRVEKGVWIATADSYWYTPAFLKSPPLTMEIASGPMCFLKAAFTWSTVTAATAASRLASHSMVRPQRSRPARMPAIDPSSARLTAC